MQIVAIIGQKGGTGKTTAATGLATAASLAGLSSAIIDLDPQTNAANWHDRREGRDGPAVISSQPGRLRQNLDAAKAAGADFVFIDTPGKSDTAAIEAAKVADLVLIPARRQIFDLETLTAVQDVLRFAGNPPAFVLLNGAHPSAKAPADELAAMIGSAYSIPVAPAYLSHRAAYADAPATGQTPQEIDRSGKAAKELAALFAFVRNASTPKHLNTRKKEKSHG